MLGTIIDEYGMTPSDPLLCKLASHADAADRLTDWPAESWSALAEHGVLRWSIPASFGGLEKSRIELLSGWETLAAHCQTTAFSLSQREAAVRLLVGGPMHLRERYLPLAARTDVVMTVGFSQLTTSRRHGSAALTALPQSDGSYLLNGLIPWVTAADHAAVMITGATLSDGTQILVTLSPTREGVTLEGPMNLSALAGSRTAQVRCENVIVHAGEILAGPAVQVLGPIGGGGLETSCLALGLVKSVIMHLESELALRPDLQLTTVSLDRELKLLRSRLLEEAVLSPEPERILGLRADATQLALRASQLLMLTSRGSGFVSPHPAQRLARQALFYLVWSCPRLVTEALVSHLSFMSVAQQPV